MRCPFMVIINLYRSQVVNGWAGYAQKLMTIVGFRSISKPHKRLWPLKYEEQEYYHSSHKTSNSLRVRTALNPGHGMVRMVTPRYTTKHNSLKCMIRSQHISLQIFQGNLNEYEPVFHCLDPSIMSRFLRIYPLEYVIYPVIKWELYTCRKGMVHAQPWAWMISPQLKKESDAEEIITEMKDFNLTHESGNSSFQRPLIFSFYTIKYFFQNLIFI